MQTEPALAFVTEAEDPPALVVRVNFGIFAGREATPAEIDELAKRLVPETGDVSIVSEQRHEVGHGVEALLHQVKIELGPEQLPPELDRSELAFRLVRAAERWAESCIAARHADEAPL